MKSIIENHLIKIEWSKSYPIAPDTYLYNGKVEFENQNTSNCLYQLYGDSPIYGQNVLLYIGKSKNGEIRLNQHMKGKVNRVLNLSIRFGELEYGKNVKDAGLSVPEEILICSVKPSYNSASINSIENSQSKHLILIQNRGNRGSLPLELSNYWWL